MNQHIGGIQLSDLWVMMSSREGIKELFKAFRDPRSLLALFAFPFSLLSEYGLTKNEEQIFALERITDSPRQTENRSTID